MKQLAKGHEAARIHPGKGFRIHLLVFFLVTPALWLAWYLTDRTYPWPLWSTPAWATGVLFHYLSVYVFRNADSNQFKIYNK